MRGKTELSVDETIVPMVMIEDLSAKEFPRSTLFALGPAEARGDLVLTPVPNSSAVALFFGLHGVDPLSENLPGIFTLDSVSIALNAETVKSLGVGGADALNFVVKATSKTLLPATAPTGEFDITRAVDWPLGATVKRVPIKAANWNEVAGITGSNIVQGTLGGINSAADLAGGLGTGLGLAFDKFGAITINFNRIIETPGGTGIGFSVNFAGHYDPDAEF